MSFSRKLARRQGKGKVDLGQALGQLSQAAEKAQGLNVILGTLPQQMAETKRVLDTLLEDYQTLANELEVTQYILRRAASLTPEQEQGYRADYEKLKASG
jgi:hypothetical protein